MTWLLIGLGGALGAMARHAVNVATHARYGAEPFPVGTLVVNVLGSLAAGMLAGVIASARVQVAAEARLFLMVGVLGGFTTFSAFAVDTLTLAHSGDHTRAILNVLLQTSLTLLSVSAGFWAARLA